MQDLDSVLQDLGQFGLFQAYSFTLLLFPVILSGFRTTEYMFLTMDVPHRCRVPECEQESGPVVFSPPWLSRAIPLTTDRRPAPCVRYRPLDNQGVTSCPAELFITNVTDTCDDWVFEEPINTVATEFHILCPEVYWKRTLLSSVSVFSDVVGLLFTGLLSDRFGRKTVLVASSVYLSVVGALKSFASSYFMLTILEVLSGFTIDTIFNSALVLGLESLASDKWLLGSMLINMFFTSGEVVLALDMWLFEDWRLMLRAFYTPMVALVALYWGLSESIRWLYSKGRFEDVEDVCRRISKMNGTEDKFPNVVNDLRTSILENTKEKDNIQRRSLKEVFGPVFKSRAIMWRVMVCSMSRVTSAMVSFGTTQGSVYFKGNRYVTFIFICLVELVSYAIGGWLPAWKPLGRRGCLVVSFFLSAVTYVAMYFVTPDQVVLNLGFALVGKLVSTLAIAVNYIYEAELFPTEARSTLVSVCTMMSCLGLVVDQQIPLIEMYISPKLIFAASSIVASALLVTCPETLGTKLPDTVFEAEQIGKSSAELHL